MSNLVSVFLDMYDRFISYFVEEDVMKDKPKNKVKNKNSFVDNFKHKFPDVFYVLPWSLEFHVPTLSWYLSRSRWESKRSGTVNLEMFITTDGEIEVSDIEGFVRHLSYRPDAQPSYIESFYTSWPLGSKQTWRADFFIPIKNSDQISRYLLQAGIMKEEVFEYNEETAS